MASGVKGQLSGVKSGCLFCRVGEHVQGMREHERHRHGSCSAPRASYLLNKGGVDCRAERKGDVARHAQRRLARALGAEGPHRGGRGLEQGDAEVLRNVLHRHGLVLPGAVRREPASLAVVKNLGARTARSK